jgi:hypothetical protein
VRPEVVRLPILRVRLVPASRLERRGWSEPGRSPVHEEQTVLLEWQEPVASSVQEDPAARSQALQERPEPAGLPARHEPPGIPTDLFSHPPRRGSEPSAELQERLEECSLTGSPD